MTEFTTLPIEDLYESTLQSDLGEAELTAKTVKLITGTLTGGATCYMGIDYDKPSKYELVKINAINGQDVTIETRGVKTKAGGTGAAQFHAAGAKVIITHSYKVFEDIATALASKADGTPALYGDYGYANDAARDAAIPSPVNDQIVVSNGLLQYYAGGAWQTLGVGSATPNASTTVAGKVEIATQSEANAGTDTGGTGALLSVVPSNLAVLAQDNKYTYAGTTAGSSTVYTATVTPAPSAYAAGQGFTVLMDETNGASPTINFNGLGAKSIVDASGTAIPEGFLPSGALVDLKYNGTSFQVMNVTPNLIIPQLVKYQVGNSVGDSTTQFDITNPAGSTWRYTWDGTGTDPSISSTTCPVNTVIRLMGTNFNAANTGNFVVTNSGTNFFEVTNASGVAENDKTLGSGVLYLQGGSIGLGDSTTQFDITNPAGSTWRYTWDGTGTDPVINADRIKIGDIIDVQAGDFATENKGLFTVTGVGANYFEVTNASGSAQSNVDIVSGYINIGSIYTPRAGVKYQIVEVQGAGSGGGGTENDGGNAGAYAKKTSLFSTTNISVGLSVASTSRVGGRTLFGSIIANGGEIHGTSTPATASGGDLNLNGGCGWQGSSTLGSGAGGGSFLGMAQGNCIGSGHEPGNEYGGGGVGSSRGGHGVVLITEYY